MENDYIEQFNKKVAKQEEKLLKRINSVFISLPRKKEKIKAYFKIQMLKDELHELEKRSTQNNTRVLNLPKKVEQQENKLKALCDLKLSNPSITSKDIYAARDEVAKLKQEFRISKRLEKYYLKAKTSLINDFYSQSQLEVIPEENQAELHQMKDNELRQTKILEDKKRSLLSLSNLDPDEDEKNLSVALENHKKQKLEQEESQIFQ